MTEERRSRSNKGSKPSSTKGARPVEQKSVMPHFIEAHQKVAKSTLHSLLQQPFANLFTCFVIGIALVLPTLLTALLSSVEELNQHWDGSPQITLLLKKGVPSLDAGVLSSQIAKKQSVASTQFIDSEQALADFKNRFEYADVIDFLDGNPLPHTIIVRLHSSIQALSDIEKFRDSLITIPEVETAILDAAWIQRLQSISQVVEQTVWVVAAILSLTVVLVLGNTIKLAIENRKEEIIVVKLVGGTDAFVRRPFLYMGLFLGYGASVLAWFFIHGVIYLLNEPVSALAESYQLDFSLSGLSFLSTLFLLIFGLGLGWLSAWLAVRKHLDEIEPS